MGTAEAVVAEESGSPRVGLVFRLWQCDKENHGWPEGRPQTVLPSSIAWLAFTLVSQCRTKKEYCFLPASVRTLPQTARLAGILRHIGSHSASLVLMRCIFLPKP